MAFRSVDERKAEGATELAERVLARTVNLVFRRPVDPALPFENIEGAVQEILGVAAAERGKGLAFIDEVSNIIWSGKIDGWDQGSHLADAAARAGLELAPLDSAIQTDPERFEAAIGHNQDAHAAAGHWGVPTMVFDGEPFFGQDRLDVLTWRMEQRGLAAKS